MRFGTWFIWVGSIAALGGGVCGCSQQKSARVETTPGAGAKSVRVGGIVLKWVLGEKDLNYRRAEPLIRQAAARGAEIVVTTECFLDGYAIRDRKMPADRWRTLCESVPDGAYVRRLRDLARELRIHLVAGFVQCENGASYNTAILIGPEGSVIGRYHKQDLEHELWRNTPGAASPTFPTPFGRIGLIICADRRNAPLVRRIAEQSDLVICPSGGMWGPQKNDFYLQDRSRENRIPIVFVHPTEFLVTGPDGAILERRLIGDEMTLTPAQLGGEKDVNEAVVFDVPLGK